jgi:hypothetical protein
MMMSMAEEKGSMLSGGTRGRDGYPANIADIVNCALRSAFAD